MGRVVSLEEWFGRWRSCLAGDGGSAASSQRGRPVARRTAPDGLAGPLFGAKVKIVKGLAVGIYTLSHTSLGGWHVPWKTTRGMFYFHVFCVPTGVFGMTTTDASDALWIASQIPQRFLRAFLKPSRQVLFSVSDQVGRCFTLNSGSLEVECS